MKWLMGILTVALAAMIGLYIWSVHDFDTKCRAAGGTVETRFEYFQPTSINGVVYNQPIYSYHCWVNGEEI